MPEELKYAAINQFVGVAFDVAMQREPIIVNGCSFVIWDNATTPNSKDQASIVIQPEVMKTIVEKKLIGWKFQISIDDAVNGNMEKAWNLLQELLFQEGFPFCKVIKNSIHLDETHKPWERGKQITIYTDCGPYPVYDQRWRNLLTRITEVFNDGGIRPSYIPCNCKKISPYISYRNDFSGSIKNEALTDIQSLKMVTDVADAFNPFGQGNPFADFLLDLPLVTNPQFSGNDWQVIRESLKALHVVEMNIGQEADRKRDPDGCCPCCSCTMI